MIEYSTQPCSDYSPFALEGIELERFHLSTTRNCKGPAFRTGEIKDKVTIQATGEAHSQPSTESNLGELVCRNTGIKQSIDSLLEQSA